MQEILFVSLGTTVLDEIRIPGQKPLLNVLGGSGIYGKQQYLGVDGYNRILIHSR